MFIKKFKVGVERLWSGSEWRFDSGQSFHPVSADCEATGAAAAAGFTLPAGYGNPA